MINTLAHWFQGWCVRLWDSSRSQPLKDARARRSEALRAAARAAERADDRDYGRALMQARQATADVLRLELGR